MTRAEIRKEVFILSYQSFFYEGDNLKEHVNEFVAERELEESETVINKFWQIYEIKDELDELINKYSVGWKTSRMNKVDLAILRLAVYEIRYDEEIPKAIAINEAVNLAKKFSSDKSPAFINGILGKIDEQKTI